MKKNIKEIYILESLIFVLASIAIILKIDYALQIILVLSALVAYYRFGFPKDNAYEKASITRIVISNLLAFTIIMYGLGVFTGFYKSSYLADFKGFIINLILLVSYILSEELIRYIIAKNCTKNKKPLIIFTIIFIIINIATQINLSALTDRWTLFVFVSAFVLPIIAREMLSSYLSYKCGLMPILIYRLLMEVGFHLFPIIPNLGDYLYAIIRIVLPALVFFFSSKVFRYHAKSDNYTKKAGRIIVIVPTMILSLIMIYLVSGLFKYKMIAIGSGSMEPVYYLGDAVIYEKKKAAEVKTEDILVFHQGQTIITHRVLSITKDAGGKYNFVTKGDNNTEKDNYIVQEEDVLGIVKVPVKYIGYPTLWVNELIER